MQNHVRVLALVPKSSLIHTKVLRVGEIYYILTSILVLALVYVRSTSTYYYLLYYEHYQPFSKDGNRTEWNLMI